MKIPKDARKLSTFAQDLVDECMVSRERRRMQARAWRQLFYTGSMGGVASKHNRCYDHVDKLSSYLFSPSDVHYTVEFDDDYQPEWANKKDRAGLYINKKLRKCGAGRIFGKANELALIEGSAIVKMTWNAKAQALKPWVIPQSFFGVLREDLEDLDDQEAFCHSYYVTPAVFNRMIWQHADRDDLMVVANGMAAVRGSDELTGDSYFHEIVTGGMVGISGLTTPRPSRGSVSVTMPMGPMLAADVAQNLLRIDDLWVWDDARDDWTTIRYLAPGIIVEGRYQHRSMSDLPGRHPFVRVCSNEVTGYFWGRSELATVLENQMVINDRTDDVDMIFRLQARPPRALTGGMGVTEEKVRALLSPGGVLTESAQGAKVENMAPEMPSMAMDYLDKLDGYFDQAGGFNNILSGQGEPGVRAGLHAGVLLRTSTPRLRDRALLIEEQCAKFGTIGFQICQAKDATVLHTRGAKPADPKAPKQGEREEFLLSQLEGAEVTVDSHTSSPAFSDDNRQLAYALFKAQAIDPLTLIEMVHPPREELLKERFVQSQEAQAKFLAANPQLAAEQGKKK